MKNTLIKIIATSVLAASAQAAVTFTFNNYTTSSNGPAGLPIVNSSGFSILNSSNSLFASIGYLTPGGDSSAASVLSRFVAIDASPTLINAARPGTFNSSDYNSITNVYPSGFQGQTAVALIGNNSTIANSTAIAAFGFIPYGAPDVNTGALVQSFTLNASSVPLVGTITPMANGTTAQPNTATTTPFLNGVQLVSIVPVPETSTSLLGAIGALALLRRRRN